MRLNTDFKKSLEKYNLDQHNTLLYILDKLGILSSDLSHLNEQEVNRIEYLFLQRNGSSYDTKIPLFAGISFKIPVPLSSDEITKNIQTYRNVFKGLKTGSMGDKKACISKLKKWFEDYPDKTIEDVIAAAKYYIRTLNKDYTYLQQADYFIMKNGQSRLSTMIDEVQGENYATLEDDVFTKLR